MSNSSEAKGTPHHADAEASNALANIVTDRLGFVSLTGRYGIAGDFLRWLDQRRPAWREKRTEDEIRVEALRQAAAAAVTVECGVPWDSDYDRATVAAWLDELADDIEARDA